MVAGLRKGRAVTIDVRRSVLKEMLDCVETRLRWYRARRKTPPHVTVIAQRMLHVALEEHAEDGPFAEGCAAERRAAR